MEIRGKYNALPAKPGYHDGQYHSPVGNERFIAMIQEWYNALGDDQLDVDFMCNEIRNNMIKRNPRAGVGPASALELLCKLYLLLSKGKVIVK